jgi:tetratricopeptide (TPR) repeat protein
MAQVLLMLEDYHSAERFSLRAMQADPNYYPAYLHLGIAYLYLGNPETAHQWLSLAETFAPDSWISEQASRLLSYYFP